MNDIHVLILYRTPTSEDILAMLRQVSPRLVIEARTDNEADKIGDLWRRAEVLYTDDPLPPEGAAPNLKWIQGNYAGVDRWGRLPVTQPYIWTTTSGIHGHVAELALLLMLAFARKFMMIVENQKIAGWPENRIDVFEPYELRDSTVGIVGYGSIGRELARLLQPYNAKVLAVKRDVMHPQDTGYMPDGMGDPEGNLFTRLYPIQALRSMLKSCDYVVVTLPLNQHTHGLIKQEDLAVMKPTAFLIDIGRGGIVDPDGLFAILQERRIAGAAVDVFPEEPLPAGSPLWKLPNLILTPHIAGFSSYYNERAAALFAENLRRYLSGSALLNRFDLQKGY